MPRRNSQAITFLCALEKPSCIKADGDGGWEVKVSVPDSQSAEMLELAKLRGVNLICVICRQT